MGIVRGFALMLSGAGIQNFPYAFIYIGQSKLLGLQAPVWYMIFIVGLFSFCRPKQNFSGVIILLEETNEPLNYPVYGWRK